MTERGKTKISRGKCPNCGHVSLVAYTWLFWRYVSQTSDFLVCFMCEARYVPGRGQWWMPSSEFLSERTMQ
jgi:transcription elongation factor Elf1